MPWRANDYEELINRDKAGLELNESDNLIPTFSRRKSEIVEDLEAPWNNSAKSQRLEGEATKETTDVAVRFAESELFQHWRGRYNEDVNGGLYPNVLPDRLCLSDE